MKVRQCGSAAGSLVAPLFLMLSKLHASLARIYAILLVFILFAPPAALVAASPSGATTVNASNPAEDSRAFDEFTTKEAPNGYLTIVGGKKPLPGSPHYEAIRKLSAEWTRESGLLVPIATGDGAGIAEAVHTGATEARGKSLAFTLGRGAEAPSGSSLVRRQTFTNYSQLVSDVIDRSKGMVFSHGDLETYWFLLEVITKIQTKQIPQIPIVLMGEEKEWEPLFHFIKNRIALGTVSPAAVGFMRVARTPEEALAILKNGVRPGPLPPLVPHRQIAKDVAGILDMFSRLAPYGTNAVFGGWRVRPGQPPYDLAREFSFLWAKKTRGRIPIITGGGPGVMRAGNEGGNQGGRPSLALPMGTLAAEQKPNEFATDHYTSITFAQREGLMIDTARLITFLRGGLGTGWEWFETLAKKKHGGIPLEAVFYLGPREEWEPLERLMHHIQSTGEIAARDWNFVKVSESAEHAMTLVPEDFLRFACDLAKLAPSE